MALEQRIGEILADDHLDDDSSPLSKAELIETLIDSYGWEPIREYFLELLRDDRQANHWRTAADVFWGAVLDGRELPADELIALLYYRFDPDGQTEDNYDPLHDPEVQRHLRVIRGRANTEDQDPTVTVDWMPVCEICGNPMRLVDIRAKAASLRYSLPDDGEQFVIECCGYRLRIDGYEIYQTAIRNLKKYHNLS